MDGILKNEISLLLKEITEVTDYLYQQKSAQGLKRLDTLLGKIMTVIDKLFSYKATGKIDFDENVLAEALTLAMNAIEEKDYVMLSDVLIYEIAAQLSEISGR